MLTVRDICEEIDYLSHPCFGDIISVIITHLDKASLFSFRFASLYLHVQCELHSPLKIARSNLDTVFLLDAACSGHTQLIKWLMDTMHVPFRAFVLLLAVQHGHMDTLIWCVEEISSRIKRVEKNATLVESIGVMGFLVINCTDFQPIELCNAAARTGRLDLLAYLWEKGCGQYSETVTSAIRSGRKDVIEYALENGCHCPTDCRVTAAAAGDLEILRYLEDKFLGYDHRVRVCELAAVEGHLDILRYAHENGYPWDGDSCRAAARNGHLSILKYLHENGCSCRRTPIYYEAIISGQLDVVMYLYENDFTMDMDACDYAATRNSLPILIYLRERGFPWSSRTCLAAIVEGNLEVFAYAHENGCPVHREACLEATIYGHLNILRYAHEAGYEWDERVCRTAAYYNNLDCLRYAHENGCPWDEKTKDPLTQSDSDSYESMEEEVKAYLFENHCPGSEKIYPRSINYYFK
jgi:hypothetical protein